jgi:hypothetical protein
MSSTPVSEYQILEAVRQTPTERWDEVLAFVTNLRAPVAPKTPPPQWTAAELLKLPLAERETILTEQAARAEGDYASDPELTAFDAYGEDDLHVDSSDTQTR